MAFSKRIPFTLEGVEGELALEYTPLSQSIFQNNKKLRRAGSFGARYMVETTDGATEPIKVLYNVAKGKMVEFRGKRINLEEKLKPYEYIIGCIPFCILLFFIGAIPIICAMAGSMISLNYMRVEKNVIMQVLVSVGFAVVSFALCYGIIAFFTFLMYGTFMVFR